MLIVAEVAAAVVVETVVTEVNGMIAQDAVMPVGQGSLPAELRKQMRSLQGSGIAPGVEMLVEPGRLGGMVQQIAEEDLLGLCP